MQLKRLEVFGFKAFVNRTKIEFGPGITAIVGPNGSGKSNIVDAIRWVIGEANPRNLRGTKLDDVIFAGSEMRKPLGLAEVTLVLDNSDGSLPIEFAEVTVTRRTFRSGESEFFINKAACRLHDITNLFLDKGLGRYAFTIVDQVRMEEILSYRSSERLALIEETAGILKYKARKASAWAKLMDAEAQAARLEELLAMMESQLSVLKESADRAELYLKHLKEAREWEGQLKLNQLVSLDARLLELRRKLNEISDWINLKHISLQKASVEQDELQRQVRQVRETFESRRSELMDLLRREERLRNEVHLQTERELVLEENIKRLRSELNRLTARLNSLKLSEVADGEPEEFGELESRMEARRKELLKVLDKERSLERECDALQAERQRLVLQESKLRHDADEAQRKVLASSHWLTSLHEDLGKLEKEADAVRKKEAELLAEIQQMQAQVDKKSLEVEAIRAKLGQAELETQTYRKELELRRSELATIRSKIELVREMAYRRTGGTQGPRAVLELLTRGHAVASGVIGTVADIITVAPGFEIAIERALGGAADYVVVMTSADAERIISHLKHFKLGNATFLPLDILRPQGLPDWQVEEAKRAGALGVATEFVNAKTEYDAVLQYLLSRVLVTAELKKALSVGRALGFRVRIVTLEGEVIYPGGAISGGSLPPKASSPISRIAEFRSLSAQLEQAAAQVRSLEGKVQDAEVVYKRLLGEFQSLMVDMEKSRARLDSAQAALLETRRQGEFVKGRAEAVKSQIAETEAEIFSARTSGALALTEADRLKETLTELEEKLSSRESELRALRQGRQELQEELQKYDSYFAARKERAAWLTEEKKQIELALKSVSEELANACAMKDQVSANKTSITAAANEVVNQRKSKEKEIEVLEARFNELKELADQNNRQLERLKKLIARQQEIRHTIELEIARSEVEQAQLEREVKEFGISRDELKKIDDVNQVVSEIERLKAQASALEPVNLAAVKEYDELKQRFDFLLLQREDLKKASRDLEKIIRDMDSQIDLLLGRTFQQVRAAFSSMFARLFGGGSGDLIWRNDKEGEPEIEILAQPPGKSTRNLNMLSGGERALSALAFIFALLTVRPVPFCVMDEVDASLDDANVQMLAQILSEIARQVQLIIITHQRITMEAADVLCGITMEEPGVSKLVSVRMAEPA